MSQIKFSWVPLISWPHATQCSSWAGVQWTLPTGGSGGGICVIWAVVLCSRSLCVWGCIWVVYTCAYMLWNRHWSWKGMGRVLAWATAVSMVIILIALVVVSSACVRRSIFPYPFHLALFSVLWVAVISPNIYCVCEATGLAVRPPVFLFVLVLPLDMSLCVRRTYYDAQ